MKYDQEAIAFLWQMFWRQSALSRGTMPFARRLLLHSSNAVILAALRNPSQGTHCHRLTLQIEDLMAQSRTWVISS